jgi:hypothetical protein
MCPELSNTLDLLQLEKSIGLIDDVVCSQSVRRWMVTTIDDHGRCRRLVGRHEMSWGSFQ